MNGGSFKCYKKEVNWTHLLPQENALAFLYEVILGMVTIGNLTKVKKRAKKVLGVSQRKSWGEDYL